MNFLLQFLPDKDFVLNSSDVSAFQNTFLLVDETLSSLGFTTSDKQTIHMNLSAILNLGNVEFVEDDSDYCVIRGESMKFLYYAADLLNIEQQQLSDALTTHTRLIGGQEIK